MQKEPLLKNLLQISAFTLLVGLLFFGLTNCKKPVTVYPDEPHIDLVDCRVEKEGSGQNAFYTYVVTLNFTDGDGDLGLSETDTDTPFNFGSLYYNNMHADYYEKVNGTFKKVVPSIVGDTIELIGRFPVLTPETKAKAIKGTIIARLVLGPWEPGADRGNVTKLKVWVNDRALHHSNVVETQEIVLN
jgi:hypothetical protein